MHSLRSLGLAPAQRSLAHQPLDRRRHQRHQHDQHRAIRQRNAVIAVAGSAHQSHAYVDGACLYFSLRGEVEVSKRAEWYRAAWDAANAILLRYNATLSHHHGVGLLRAPYMAESLGTAFSLLQTTKKMLDPKNLLNPGKLGLSDDITP